MNRYLIIPIALIVLLGGCASIENKKIFAEISNQGLIEPFSPTVDGSGKPVTFEPSSVYVESDYIYLISDKPQPDGFPSPMIKFQKDLLGNKLIDKDSIVWVDSGEINAAKKIEAITKSLDGKNVYAT
ncbi:MAG: hypothetical protein ABW157_09220 [Candidatus Thiodiazotropha sp. LLP2]